MTILIEYELRCDIGLPDEPFACSRTVFAATARKVVQDARATGWTVRRDGSGARCPDHRGK